VEFTPNSDKVKAKNISYVQTLIAKRGDDPILPSDPAGDFGGGAEYGGADYRRVDFLEKSESDPFYGTRWDGTHWVDEPGATQMPGPGQDEKKMEGSRPANAQSPSAVLNDSPTVQVAQNESKLFETAAVVLETGQMLASIRWGYRYRDEGPTPVELVGGNPEDCVEGASPEVNAAVTRFYAARFIEILDTFAPASATLSAQHTAQLDHVAAALKARPQSKVQLGGAADLSESDATGVAGKRAEAASSYLKKQGIDPSRIEVTAYGSDWARVPTTAGAAQAENRRVQVWIHD
jgi:outer membrane protein OmpA-like peptidoglycan-associated protein